MWLKACQGNRRISSADQEADEFPDAIKKVIQEKGYIYEQVFNADEMSYFGEKKVSQRILIT